MDTLCTELNNSEFSRLGYILYLDIKRGNESMKSFSFQQQIRKEADCMKRIMRATKGCGQLSSNYTFFADICLRVVKI